MDDKNVFTDSSWALQYRPRTIKDVILPQKTRDLFVQDEETGLIALNNHYLFIGSQGSGKTTLAECLSKGRVSKEINGSLNRGIDAIRTDVVTFASTKAHNQKKGIRKLLHIDEADQLTQDAQMGLRGAMTKFQSGCVWIFTANYDTFSDPLKSRFEVIDFDWRGDDLVEVKTGMGGRLIAIARDKGFEPTIKAIKYIVNEHYPDMRSMINHLQRGCTQASTKTVDVDDFKDVIEVKKKLFFEFMLSKPNHEAIYKRAMLKTPQAQAYAKVILLGSAFIKWIYENHPQLSSKMPMVADYIEETTYKMSYRKNGCNQLTLYTAIHKVTQILNS